MTPEDPSDAVTIEVKMPNVPIKGGHQSQSVSSEPVYTIQLLILPPPLKNLLPQKRSREIIFGVIATLSRNQLRKRIL